MIVLSLFVFLLVSISGTNNGTKEKEKAIIIPAKEPARQTFPLQIYVEHGIPVLFVGPTGTGKLAVTNNFRNQLPKTNCTPISINSSARTTAIQTQDIIMSKLDRRRKGLLGFPAAEKANGFVGRFTRPDAIVPTSAIGDKIIIGLHFSKGFEATFLRHGKMVAVGNFVPTPSKSPYVFNLYDFSQAIRGVLLCPHTPLQDGEKLIRHWIPEVYWVFYDRLTDEEERKVFSIMVNETTSDCLQQSADKVAVMQKELTALQPGWIQTSAETEKMAIHIEKETIEVDPKMAGMNPDGDAATDQDIKGII